METVNYFIINGEFKNAPMGIDITEFIGRFGKSEYYDTVSEKDKRITLMKYGIIEFNFGGHNFENLDGVLFVPPIYPVENFDFEIDLQWINDKLTYDEVRINLRKEGIEFEERKNEYQLNFIETPSGVKFLFYNEEVKELRDLKLNKFGIFKR